MSRQPHNYDNRLPEELKYRIIDKGQQHEVSAAEMDGQGGIAGYANAHPDATIEMHDDSGSEYSVPIKRAQEMSDEGWMFTMSAEQPTPQQVIAANVIPTVGRAQLDRSRDALKENFDNRQQYRLQGGVDNKSVAGGMQYNPVTGHAQQTLIRPSGENVFSLPTANDYKDYSVGAQLREATKRLRELEAKRDNRAVEVDKEWIENNKDNKAPLSLLLARDTYAPKQITDNENRALALAINQTKDLIEKLEDQRDREQGIDVGFWRGFGRTAGDARTWDFGLGDMLDAITMLNADQLIGENATEGEKEAYNEMMRSIYDSQVAGQRYDQNANFWNRAGVMAGYMPSFIVDFVLTGGGFKGINAASKAASKAATKALGKEAIKNMSEMGVKSYIKQFGAKGLGQEVANYTIKALGVTADDLLIRAPLMANTIQAGKTGSAIIENKLGDVTVDDDGSYQFSNDKSWGEAAWQTEADQIIENYSEMVGTYLDPVLSGANIGKLANVFGAKRLSGMLAKADAGALGRISRQTQRIFGQMGLSNYVGEVGEEYYGQLWRTLLGLDSAYQQNPDGTRTNLFATGQFHGDIWGGMALSMGMMDATRHGVNAARYAYEKHKVNTADKKAGEIVGNDVWESLRQRIDNTSNEEMGDMFVTMLLDEQLNQEQKEAILDYMEKSMNFRGYNLASMADSRNTEKDPIRQEANESYTHGNDATDAADMQDIKNTYDLQLQQASQQLTPEIIAEIDSNPVNAISALRERGELSQPAIDYINARQAYIGMMQRIDDDINEAIEQNNSIVDKRTNKDTGLLQEATLKVQNDDGTDRRVHIIKGNIALRDDDTVDKDRSDRNIAILDVSTGEEEIVSPDAIFSVESPVDPAQEKAIAADAVRQSYTAQAEAKMNGIVSFQPGDTYNILTPEGESAQIQIVPNANGMTDNGDGTVNVTSDNGQTVVVMSKDEIQGMVNAANIARVASRIQPQQQQETAISQEKQQGTTPNYYPESRIAFRDENGNIVQGVVNTIVPEDNYVLVDIDTPNGLRVVPYKIDLINNNLESITDEEGNVIYSNHEANEKTIKKEMQNGNILHLRIGLPFSSEGYLTETPLQEGPDLVPTSDNTSPSDNKDNANLSQIQEESALSRIPIDENGQPIYEQTDPETAWDAIVEQTGGNEDIAVSVVNSMISDKESQLKKVEKSKPKGGTTIAEKIAAEQERNNAIQQAQAELKHWRDIANVPADRQRAAQAEARRLQDEQARENAARIEQERRAKEEAERIERETLNGVPDMIDDTPADARARGYRRVSGNRVDRQPQNIPSLQGKEVKIKFNDSNIPTGHVAIIDASLLQPSHINGQRNPKHFIDEAQPKERKGDDSTIAASRIASNIRPEEITSSVTAYTGAPTVNTRGEVIQGNNRSTALREMWSNYPEQAAIYRQYLIDNAEEFGMNPQDIAAIQNPVLVNMLDIDDAKAIELGQYVASDTESGGIERIRPKNIIQRMGKDIQKFTSNLFNSTDEEATFAQLIDRNGGDVLKWMNNKGYITPTQYRSAFDSKGTLTDEAKNDLRGIIYQSIFEGTSPQFEEMFNMLPAKAQRAILSTAYRDYDSDNTKRLLNEIQNSVRAYYALSQYEPFVNARSYAEARASIQARQSATKLVKKVIAPVSLRLKNDLAAKGVDVDDSYKHVIDNNAIRHALKKHGGQQEVKRGQIPLTDADFDRISDIVENYHTIDIENGKRNDINIRFSKSYEDGTTIYVEEKRDRRKELAMVTMWKTKNPALTDANRTETTQISDLSEVLENSASDNTMDTVGTVTGKQNDTATLQNTVSDNKDSDIPSNKQNPSGNKLVSDERYEELKRRMKAKLGQLNVGIDPEILAIGTEMAVYHIEKGARKFAEFAKSMISDLGDVVRPYLKAFYNGARDLPEVEGSGLSADMTSYDEVRTFDVANFDKENTDPFATAETVVAEQTIQEQADGVKQEIINHRNNERRKENEQTTADTEAIASQAEATANKAESDIEAATTEQQVNDEIAIIDNHLEKVNQQLALLGYYEAEPVESDFNEAYGYMRNAEKKAVKDANSLAKRLIKDLGIAPDTIIDKKGKKRKSYAVANIAPAGGDISIRLPLTNDRELYIDIDLDTDYKEGIRDNLILDHVYFRIENPTANGQAQYVGNNVWLNSDTTYSDMLKKVRDEIKYHAPGFNLAEVSTKSEENKTEKTKKARKNAVSSHIQGNLFGELFEEESEPVNEPQKFSKGEKVLYKGQPATVFDIEADGRPVLDTGLAPMMYEVAELSDVKRINDNENGLQGNDAVRSERLPADSDRHEERLSEGSESGSEIQTEESRGTDSIGERGGNEIDRTVRPRPADAVTAPKNTRNNHSERGVNHAPTSVDARIDANIKAIELAQQLIENGDTATPEQMSVLRKFSGWGGLGKAFSDNQTALKLQELLGAEGLEQAIMSANSAYYTPAYIVDTLWDIAEQIGFKGGNILEGSAGIGNILGQMPTSISERSDIHAIEIDQTSGSILSLLYPDAKVDIQGFEQTRIPNGSVDLAITNVPFVTGLRVDDTTGDKDLSKKFHNIHDFCIAKNVRKLREGGIGIFISSNGTLDNSKKLRDWIVSEGGSDFVGAFRMNNKTFGGTAVTSDIIVIRKRVNGKKSPNAIDVSTISGERTAEFDTGETRKVKGQEIPVIKQLSMDYNRYFIEHPENMAGTMRFAFEEGDTFRPTSKGLYPARGKSQEQMLSDFVNSFSGKDWTDDGIRSGNETTSDNGYVADATADGKKVGELYEKDGKLVIASVGGYYPLEVNANKVKGHTKLECFKAYEAIKKALADVLDYQTNNESDKGLKPLLDKLNKAYDDFVSTYGHFNKNTSIAFLKNDVDFPNVFSLEKYEETGDKKGNKVQKFGKTDVFNKRVVEKEKEPTPTNVKDGIIASVFKFGRIDVPYIAGQLGENVEDVRKDIIDNGYGFEDPATRQIEVSFQYLSGNVREKLRIAQENNENGIYDGNIKALQEVIPMDIPAHLIDFTLGSSWIDPKLYEDYVKERTDIDVRFTATGGTWFMKSPDYGLNVEKNRSMGVVSEMLHKTIFGHTLIEAAIQNRSITVSQTNRKWDGTTETITDKEATQACSAKIDEIRQDFKDWARQKMQSDSEMSATIERIYNDTFNNFVPMSIPDDFVPEYFGGASHKFKMRSHQGKAIVRGIMQPLLLAHEVGTGKTFTLISTAMEMRRLGTARKPMIVVQNATVGQFVASAKELYPNAKILTLEESDRSAEGRKNFYAKIRYNDWDMIVVPQSTFEFIPDSEERQMAFVQDKIQEKMIVLEQMKEADPNGKSMITRQAEREIEQLEEQLAGLTDEASKKRTANDQKKKAVALQNAEVRAKEMLDRRTDDVENFDDMGIDALLIDEAHEYKHLGFATAMQRGVKGVDPSYSKKSQGVYLKTQAVLEKNNGRNVIFATGTPISNTAAEIWTFMRYLMPSDTMKEYGIYYFDDFVRNFGNIQQMLEFTTSGKFKENNRFAGYVNLPELVRIWSGVADTVLTREAGGVSDKIPEIENGKAQDIYLPQTRALRGIMKYVKAQLEEFEKMSGKEKREHSYIPLTMYGIAKAAAVDARLVQADAEDDPNSKTNEAVRQTLRSLKETASYKGTVAIFADNYQNNQSGFNIYEDIKNKLIAEGVPAEQIVVMKSGITDKKKLEIFAKVNRGEVRVILGSTFTLGTGVNIQERLHTLIHLDAPNRPMDYTQRNGRILRQGNLHKEMGKPVRILRFGVEDSLDVTAYQRLKTKGAIADSIMNGKQMMSNSMVNRVLEEDEDVFGDTVAQLSGSEYAMLKNNAEKNVRKYESRKKQWEADQTYIHNAKPKFKALIAQAERTEKEQKGYLEAVRKAFPEGTFNEITAGKRTFASVEAMADFFKEYNKSIAEATKKLKEGGSNTRQTRNLTVSLGGFSFIVQTTLSSDTVSGRGQLFTEVHRKMTYSCPELGLSDIPVHQGLLRNAIEDIVSNVITGKDFSEKADAAERNAAHNRSELEQLEMREGKPFEFDKELEQAHKQFQEYSEAMRKEMAEKEAKYAEVDASIDTADNISINDDDDVLMRDDDTVYRYTKVGNISMSENAKAAKKEGKTDVGLDRGLARFIEKNGYGTFDDEYHHVGADYNRHYFVKLNDGVTLAQVRKAYKEYTQSEEKKRIDEILDKYPNAIPRQEVLKEGGRVFPMKNPTHRDVGYAGGQYWFVPNEDVSAEINERFNNELQQQIDGTLPKGHVYQLGRPSKTLLSTGIPDLPIELSSTRLAEKAGLRNHEFAIADVKGLPKAMQNPIAVFSYGNKDRSQNIIVGIERDGKNFVVGLHLNQYRQGIEVNSIRGIFPKDNAEWLNWITQGKLLYADKQKIQTLINKQRTNLADVEYLDLDSIANIVKSFENPSTEDETLRTTEQAPVIGKTPDMADRVQELAEKLHLDNVEIVTTTNGLDGKKARAKGFYTKSIGKITIVLPNNRDIDDAIRTLLHEAVAHYGLRKMFGKQFDTFLDNVFNNADTDVRRHIVELSKKHGWNFRTATEEYLASLAEQTNFEEINPSWWQKIKELFLRMLHNIGLKDFSGTTLSDNELRYILWRSYENLRDGTGMFEEAADIAKQYELKVGNYAETDNELFRDDSKGEYEQALARDRYEERLSKGMYQTQEALQDSMLSVREAMDAVLRAEGKKMHVEDIAGFENAYLGENRLSSVNKAEADAFAHTLFKPLLDEVARLSHNEEERMQLMNYMMAKHGLERNKFMAERDAKESFEQEKDKYPNITLDDLIYEYRNRDYAGLTALTESENTAVAETKAMAMVDEYEKNHDVTQLWQRIKAVNDAILSKLYETGMMSKATYDYIKGMYKYYIPLRGFDEKTSAEAYAYLTHKDSAFNAPIKKAIGRTSKADDPLAYMQSMAESAIMQGNRNKLVKQRFFNFVLNHPSDLASINDIWLQYDSVNDEWKPVFPDNINNNDTAEDVERKMQEFEEKMQALKDASPDMYKHGKETVNIPYKVVSNTDLHQHQIVVKRNGRDYIITINGNPRAAQAINGQTNPDNDLSGAIGTILKAAEKLNRQLSAFYTTRNPDFVVSNFIRDMLYANSMAWIRESPNYALRFHRNFLRANPAQMKVLFAKLRNNTLDMNDYLENMFYQFIMNGGETGYANIRDIENRKNDIRRELRRANGKLKIGKAVNLLGERLDEYNRAVENCARFAAFMTSREMGRTIDRSIYDAKEASVNFNKKGSGSKFYNSEGQTGIGNIASFISGLGRSSYVFWNAAIQGTTNFGRQAKRHPAKAFTGLAAAFILGALIVELGGDDDDDKNAYYNLPEYVRRSNIMFRAGDSWISIPLPVEYRAVYGLGELMTSTLKGKENLTDGEMANQIASQVSQILPLDLMNDGGLMGLVPSAVKPFAEVMANESWTGLPIYKDTPWNKDMPDWTKAYKSANKEMVGFAEMLNDISGGDEYTKGKIDINPAAIQHILEGYFGGVATTIDRLAQTAEIIAGQREYDPRSILLLNRVVKNGDERTEYRAINNEYFRLKDEHDRLRARVRNYEHDTKEGIFDYAEKLDFLYNSPEYARYEIFEKYRPDIDSLYDELKETVDENDRKEIETLLNEVKRRLVEEANTTRK